MSNNGAKQDNLENKPQIRQLVARATGNKSKQVLFANKIRQILSGNRLKQVVAHATGNKLRRVVAPATGNKLREYLDSLKVSNKSSQSLPKIVGDIRHYPPANKEWKNSIYAYNKNSLRSLPALDKMATKTIKSYFSLTNNKKLARSERMRNLIRRRTVKRLFVSKPEIKQTSDKVNITVYTFNREKQFFLRKIYFYDRNMYINKNIYLYKLWLKKNLLAFQKTFKDRKSLASKKLLKNNKKIQTVRKNKNKTYIHKTYIRNILLKKYLASPTVSRGRVVRGNALQGRRLNRKLLTMQGLRPLIRNNLLKSMRKRNLIRSLKKRENKKITSAVKLGLIPLFDAKLDSKNTYQVPNGLPIQEISNKGYVKKTFKNYLIKKISKKINFKLRSFNSVMKIQKTMGGAGKGKARKRNRFKKIRLPYSNLKFKNEIRFFSFKLVSELKYIRKLFQFYFIKYILYLLHINITSASFDASNPQKKYTSKTASLVQNTKKGAKSQNNNKIKVKIIQFKNRYSYNKLKNIELLNLELLHLLKTVLLSSAYPNPLDRDNAKPNLKTEASLDLLGSEEKIPLTSLAFKGNALDFLYKKFENKYFLIFLAKFFKKEFLYINYYSKFLINQLKFGKFLPGLKLLISKIYSKKVELNIVNLKYPHLNTDIYTDSIATKLKRKIGLLRVLKWSLNLAKLPYKYLPYNNSANLNKIPSLTIHKSLDVNALSTDPSFASNMHSTEMLSEGSLPALSSSVSYGGGERGGLGKVRPEDSLQGILNKLYPNSLVHGLDQSLEKEKLAENPILLTSSKSLSILNIIKYKWVSGVRLEAAGRLTRRYTAARSVFKYRYKGSLKNIDYSQKTDISKKNISTVMLRNSVKANSQYSFAKSKRRIGAFGIKAWIAGY